ncbi:IMP cyclohydrolase [Flavonifractor sp. An9]|uniref:IMP cyclohydrolase n=1 Tax=Flavonifractor sp. An9 TaxID=1965664 RepID=UPI000B37D79F|nr:IMP cyclohydrolase [Flavonifractor sp. An9]OUN10804.1 inosine monophosphate cyclohydrolase [Flavonifractor sp. An9]
MKTLDLTQLLQSNPYPGRGIVLGRSADDTKAVIAYFIMGRSENSRNRVFVETPDGIRTQAFDPSKMTDPSLIIYNPVRVFGASTIVTNGDQTDTIREGLAAGKTFSQALHTRTFEPDEPNYTPRISGLVKKDGDYVLSILKSADGDPASCRRYFYAYEKPLAGQGHFIHTYMGDGNPLPSFEGEPEQITITSETPEEFAQLIWNSLNEENKVSLFVRYIDIMTGNWETVILNKHQ